MEGERREKFLRKMRFIADYQFGYGAGEALFPNIDDIDFILSKTGRISQVIDKNKGRIATLRSYDGLLTLSIEGARRLHRHFRYPKLRVVMNKESREFVKEGRNAFCKHVVEVDEEIRAYDEVILVDEEDILLATGKAMLSGEEMKSFGYGIAVKVRYGVKE
ncbi:MAG: PUA domain-containing protein [Candidatus Methanospirareceae archaeon]